MKATTEATTERALGRTLTPYIGSVAILVLATIFCISVAFSKGAWQLAVASLVGCLLYAVVVFISAQYRVLWTSDYVRRKASGGPDVVIKISDIAKVAKETASTGQMVAQSAPFRRITVTDRSGKKIYVSLRHFRLDDVRSLMHWIHQRRPDLEIPQALA